MDFSYFGRNKLIAHFEEQHGKECVAHIGTYTQLGVKNGLKAFARSLDIPYADINKVTKNLDEIIESPKLTFKDFDNLNIINDSDDEGSIANKKAKYKKFKAIEDKYPELFRLARRFEGIPLNMGVHASGILVTPCPVNNYFATRLAEDNTGNMVKTTLFTGPQLESLKAIKLDILGLKTLDILQKTLNSVNDKLTLNDLYKELANHLDDPKLFKLLQTKATEAIFQMESPLFKGLCEKIQPTNIDDIIVMLSLGRPGPLQAKMDVMYANRKNGLEESIEQLRGTENITGSAFNCIVYQEQIMLIAKQVAGFNDAQSDSLCRKPLA